eukprot:gene5710-6601_t
MWCPGDKKLITLKYSDVQQLYFKKNLVVVLPESGFKFNVQGWFFDNEYNYFTDAMSPHQPKIYKRESDGALCINQFAGWLYTDRRAFEEKIKEDPELKSRAEEGVKAAWDHINITWCSRKADQFNYARSWLTKAISGKKMRTVLYLKNSVKGIGKGTITNFILRNVLGDRIATRQQDVGFLKQGSFNEMLMGKMFIILDELPCSSQGTWNEISD